MFANVEHLFFEDSKIYRREMYFQNIHITVKYEWIELHINEYQKKFSFYTRIYILNFTNIFFHWPKFKSI